MFGAFARHRINLAVKIFVPFIRCTFERQIFCFRIKRFGSIASMRYATPLSVSPLD
jgi:hypothetical protein